MPRKPAVPYKREFNMQKAAAKFHGCEWELTFEEWRDWWGDDIERRGRRKHDLVMGRIDTTKPYRLDNIVKREHADNIDVGRDKKPGCKRAVKTPLGEFPTLRAAADAHGERWTMNMARWCGDPRHPGFEYLN
jgi:hypothetical protein